MAGVRGTVGPAAESVTVAQAIEVAAVRSLRRLYFVRAIVSGGVMIYLALRRQRRLGGQWLIIVSGAGSVFAGLTFVTWTGSASAGLGALAQYSAGGAVWYLLTAFWLTRTARRPVPPGPVTRAGDSAR
jgi:uncharacterized membrane protein HdeD (DUF308 family)